MKFLAVGDLHIRIDTIDFFGRLFCTYLTRLIAREQIDTVVFLGDILENNGAVNVAVMDCAVKLFTTLSATCHVVVLVGNHDYVDPHQFMTDRHWMNPLKGKPSLQIVDRAQQIGECVYCPYVPPGRFVEAIESCTAANETEPTLIFAHQAFKGAQWHGGICTEDDIGYYAGAQIISGHIHGYQQVGNYVWYPGSIEPAKQNRVLIIEGGFDPRIQTLEVGRLDVTTRVGTVSEIQQEPLLNCEITIQDTAEHIAAFKSTAAYTTLCAQNVVKCIPHLIPFLDLYRANVAALGDPFVYCAAEKVLTGESQEETDHLFIKIGAVGSQ